MAGPIQVRRKTHFEAYPADFKTLWYSLIPNKVPVAFLRHRNRREDDFAVVGDVIDASPPAQRQPCFGWTFAPDPSAPWSLAHPTDFTWILDDAGSGNAENLAYWWPVAPADYVALGLCFTSGPKPETRDYWCVHKNFCAPTGKTQAWSDAGQGWKHNGDVFWIEPRGGDPDAIRQSAFLSAQALDNGMGAPMAMSAPGLNPPPPPPPDPGPPRPPLRPARRRP